MIWAKDRNSADDNPIFNFTKEKVQILKDLVYIAKSDKLTSQNTKDYIKDQSGLYDVIPKEK